MNHTETITYNSIEFEVTGDYLELIPATMYTANGDPGNPQEGGYIDGATIKLCDVDITDLLNDETIEEIESLAWNQWQGVEL